MAAKKKEERLFGTDGIRGKANEQLTWELAGRVAMAAGAYFTRNNGKRRHLAIIGKDTRLSNYMLEPAMQAGFVSVGMDVILTGPLPTPAIAMLTSSMLCDVGVMISASHNPFYDNGIKLFSANGYKLPDEAEDEIERLIKSDELSSFLAAEDKLGHVVRDEDAMGRYIQFARGTISNNTNRVSLEGMVIVIDCANGAAHKVAPRALRELGARVYAIGINPDGININDRVGSTYPKTLAAEVLMHDAHVGIALDGDADRLIMVDEKGQVIDGDKIMAVLATSWKQDGRLKSGVVATQMSNLALERYIKSLGVPFERTDVGDRYVNECMRNNGHNLGGEQSGHIICSDHSTTGDGLVAALQVLAILKKSGRPASEVLHLFNPVPQLLHKFSDPTKKLLRHEGVKGVIEGWQTRLGQDGRILVRNSGTEPVIRIMVEGDDRTRIEEAANDILRTLKSVAA